MEPLKPTFPADGTLQCVLSVRWNLTVHAFCEVEPLKPTLPATDRKNKMTVCAFCEMEPYSACFLWGGTLQCVLSVRWNLTVCAVGWNV